MQTYESSKRTLKALPVVFTIVAVGLGTSGANSQPAPTPAPVPQMFEYAVKFVCGRAVGTSAVPPPVATGSYFTAINVHNPNSGTIEFRKKFALALPNQKAGIVSQFFPAVLKTDEAFEVDCAEITRNVQVPPGRFAKGFAVFHSARELDIVAVYTAAASPTGSVVTMHMERVPKRP